MSNPQTPIFVELILQDLIEAFKAAAEAGPDGDFHGASSMDTVHGTFKVQVRVKGSERGLLLSHQGRERGWLNTAFARDVLNPLTDQLALRRFTSLPGRDEGTAFLREEGEPGSADERIVLEMIHYVGEFRKTA